MKVLGYARTTWDEQERKTGPSIREQRAKIRACADNHGLQLGQVYTDTALSKEQGTCGGLIGVLDAMHQKWTGLLVVSRDRVERVPNVTCDPVKELERAGKVLHVVSSRMTKDCMAKLSRTKPERVRLVETRDDVTARLLRGRLKGARAGYFQSGPAPFGYTRPEKKVKGRALIVPLEHEAKIVRRIFKRYLRLESVNKVRNELNESGLKPRRGNAWSQAGVAWILKNETYVGRVHFGAIKVKGQHEPIVARITFNLVQKIMRANNKRGGSRCVAQDLASTTSEGT